MRIRVEETDPRGDVIEGDELVGTRTRGQGLSYVTLPAVITMDTQGRVILRFTNSPQPRLGAATRLVLFTPDGHRDRMGTCTNRFLQRQRAADLRAPHCARYRIHHASENGSLGTSSIFKDVDGNQLHMGARRGRNQ